MTESPDETMPQASPTDESAPYRVLVVEDDRSQALFAQSVLNGAGIEATLQTEAAGVLDAIRAHKPDLVLMDLHMPEIDGMRLTTLIRQQPGQQMLPIVFLTGDRTRSASSSAGHRRRRRPDQADPATPPDRRHFQPHPARPCPSAGILAAPSRDEPPGHRPVHPPAPVADDRRRIERQGPGGVFFIEIASALGLRERYGYAAFERLMTEAGRQIAKAVAPHPASPERQQLPVLARIDDEAALAGFARELREKLSRHVFVARDEETVHCAVPSATPRCRRPRLGGSRARGDRTRRPAGRLQRPAWPPTTRPAPTNGGEDFLRRRPDRAGLPAHRFGGRRRQAQYQVLLRMRQSDGTLLTAGQVIPAAEAAGRIADLDQQVMDHALTMLGQKLANRTAAPVRFAVAAHVVRRCLSGWLLQSLQDRGIPASRW
jgi:CheY-like chemotaxis protein